MSEAASAAPMPEASAETPEANSAQGGAPAAKSNNPGVQAVLDGNKKPEAPAKETQAEKRFRLAGKVDGKEEVWEGTESEMLARLQKGSAADKRMAQAAEERKKHDARKEAIKKDPNALWKMAQEEFGIEDIDTLAEQRLLEKYKLQEMSEEQKAAYDKDQRLKAYEAQEQERKAQEEARQREEAETHQWKRIEADFTQALEKTGLPGSMEMLRSMAEIAQMNLKYDLELTPDQMAAEVKDREEQAAKKYQARFASKAGEDLLGSLGDEVTEKVRQALLARAKGKKTQTQAAKPLTPKAEETKPMTREEWRKYLRS